MLISYFFGVKTILSWKRTFANNYLQKKFVLAYVYWPLIAFQAKYKQVYY